VSTIAKKEKEGYIKQEKKGEKRREREEEEGKEDKKIVGWDVKLPPILAALSKLNYHGTQGIDFEACPSFDTAEETASTLVNWTGNAGIDYSKVHFEIVVFTIFFFLLLTKSKSVSCVWLRWNRSNCCSLADACGWTGRAAHHLSGL
jgi:hypothetical protein